MTSIPGARRQCRVKKTITFYVHIRVLYVHSMLYIILDLEFLCGPYFGRIKYSLVLLILFIPSKTKVYYIHDAIIYAYT